MEAKEATLSLILGVGVLALVTEVRRMGRERDFARSEYERLVGRIAERPTSVIMPSFQAPPISQEKPYFSDFPHDDEAWDEFAAANEAPDEPEDDE